MSVSNSKMIETATDDAYNFLQYLNDKGHELDPMVYLFEKDNSHPFMFFGLPPMENDRGDKTMKHMLLTPFMSLFPTEAVVVVQDTWFVKEQCDKKDEDGHKCSVEEHEEFSGVAPSEHINKSQGLMSMQMRKDMSGAWAMREYGRDDNGELFIKDLELSEIPDWKDSSMESWLKEILMLGLSSDTDKALEKLTEDLPEFMTEDTAKMLSINSGLVTISDLGYNFAVRQDFIDFLRKSFPESTEEMFEMLEKSIQESMEEE